MNKRDPVWDIERDAEDLPVRLGWRGIIPGTWREKAAIVINKVITETGRTNLPLLRRRLRNAYPWNERKNHSYKIWRDEVDRQLGLEPPLPRKAARHDPVPPEQGRLFV